ncbi:nucleoside deaminase [Geomicrobium sp. JSM 1781026]|uniref:nucleoside deaminase n=1 Tax=Geomicrobium sp. JSM 1781026 TaxID=3344580 RepID=UPI0035C1D20D
MITEQDIYYLERAVSLAEKGLAEGNDPFGSVLVSADGTILAEDYNRVSSGDVTKHPEIELVRFASVHLNQEERHQSTVYTSGEHCPMCATAHAMAGMGRIVYATSSSQLREWKREFGSTSTVVHPLPIHKVIVDAWVDGPVDTFFDQVKALHNRRHKLK